MGVTALTLPISARVAWPTERSAAPEAPARVRLYKVVCDERFEASRMFGKEAQRSGLSVHVIKGDITDFWFHDLYARWSRSPASIAGMTGHGAIFCLERLAWDQRMRVVFRGEHTLLPDGQIEHALSGPVNMLRDATELGHSGHQWSSQIARLLVGCPVERSQVSEATITTPMARAANLDSEPLISWVIAPVNRT
jgi:hypothetical protein